MRFAGINDAITFRDEEMAVGYSMIASRNGENFPEGFAALAEAIDNAKPLRLDFVGDED